MTINNPIALIALVSVPLIIALYLLRLKRKKKIVSSVFFWTEMIQDLQANVPFQKLRWNILLLLQILIALAIISAIIDPSIKAALNEGQRTIFVIDTSASMSATDTRESRLQSAIDDILLYCRNLSDREKVMFITAGEHAATVLDFTDRINDIEKTLNSLATVDTRSDLATAYSLAIAKASEIDRPKIVLVSDLSGIDASIFSDSEYPLSFLKVGGNARNIAITDFTVTGITGGATDMFSAFLAVRNFTDSRVHCDVEFYADGNLVDVRQIEIDTDSRMSKVYNNVPYPGGVIEVRLDYDDDLDLDNTAYAAAPVGEGMEVLIAGDDPFLTLALAGIPGIRLYRISRNEYTVNNIYDLTLFPEWAPESLPPGNYVFFNPPSRDYLPCDISDTVSSPHVTDWEDGHPIMRFVNPGNFNVFTAEKLMPRPGALTLIDGNSTPLLVYGERNYLRALVFPFDLTASDLITKSTFPILMYNIISFYRSNSEMSSSGLRTQGIEVVRIDALGEKVRLTGPGGIELEFPIDAGHAFIDVDRAGVYEMRVVDAPEDTSQTLVANFFDEAESDIRADSSLEETLDDQNVMRFEVQGEKRIWKWLSVIALIILTGEWFFYHRKGF